MASLGGASGAAFMGMAHRAQYGTLSCVRVWKRGMMRLFPCR